MTEAQAIERLRNELRMQKANIRGWMEDKRCNVETSMDSLMDASDAIDEALKDTAKHDLFSRLGELAKKNEAAYEKAIADWREGFQL